MKIPDTKNHITIGIVLAIVLIIGFSLLAKINKVGAPEGVACTLEAMICPDGSAVGRTGPNCEFEACPSIAAIDTTKWKTFSDEMVGMSFHYPETLPTTYISTTDWPPQVSTTDGPLDCTEAGLEIESIEATVSESINGNTYCITRVSEGAPGSTYTTYAYAREYGENIATMTFGLRFVQCANYDGPKMDECVNERDIFDTSSYVDAMFETLILPS